MSTSNAAFITWSAGRTDALGQPFSAWLLARRHPDGTAMRDAAGRQVFETQSEYLARCSADANPTAKPDQPAQLELFAA